MQLHNTINIISQKCISIYYNGQLGYSHEKYERENYALKTSRKCDMV